MDYTNNTQLEITNSARLAGKIVPPLVFSHEVYGEKFYEFNVEVARRSGVKDVIPVTISERATNVDLHAGDNVGLIGEFRSYNKLEEGKSKLKLSMFAKEVELLNFEPEPENEIKLVGYICKEPVYRTTPFNREICDVLLASNRTNSNKSDYIPLIMWGRNARFMGSQPVGTKVEITGRIQSREYEKTLSNGSKETRTAYEVSVSAVKLLDKIVKYETPEKTVDGKKDIG